MTREEIMTLDTEALETRAEEIALETAEADKDMLETLNAELDAIAERREVINTEIETRKKAEAAVLKGEGEIIEERKEEVNRMTNEEIRNSKEYIEAFANYVKTGKDLECRTLFSDNYVESGVTGSVPVPDFVAGIVAEQLKQSEILSRVRRMEAGGNVKVGFEISAPAATGHVEGDGEVSEEELALGIVTLIPKTWKKWVSISDEALDSMSGEAYLTYIYEEVGRGIIKARENAVVAAILAAPTTATATAPAVAEGTATTPALDDFVQARALLSSAARDLVIVCTPSQYANYRSLQMAANYAVDPFDGLPVLFNDSVSVPIIGDLAGVMENCPKGQAVEFKYDDKTAMTYDIVRILGRLPSAIEVVGNKFLARVGDADDYGES